MPRYPVLNWQIFYLYSLDESMCVYYGHLFFSFFFIYHLTEIEVVLFNCVDPDQMWCSVASDLCWHCLSLARFKLDLQTILRKWSVQCCNSLTTDKCEWAITFCTEKPWRGVWSMPSTSVWHIPFFIIEQLDIASP